MKEMLLNLLRSMIPDSGDYRFSFKTTENESWRTIAISIVSALDLGLIADIKINIPRKKS